MDFVLDDCMYLGILDWIIGCFCFLFLSVHFIYFLSFPNYISLKNLGDERRDRNEREINKT